MKRLFIVSCLLISSVSYADEGGNFLNQAPFDWNYGEGVKDLSQFKSPYPKGSPADKLWKSKMEETIKKNAEALQEKNSEEDSEDNEAPLFKQGDITVKVKESAHKNLTPAQKLNQFVGTLGFMASGMKMCRPEEVNYIERCGNLILNHWKEYSGDDIFPTEKDKLSDFKTIISDTYKDAVSNGEKEISQVSKLECENMYKSEQSSLIWKSCGRSFEKVSDDKPLLNN